MIEPLTLTIAGTRKALGLGTTKIYELIAAGELRTVKIGRRTLVKVDSIRSLVSDDARDAGADQ